MPSIPIRMLAAGLAALASGLLCGSPAAAQSAMPSSITITVPDGYPAFRPQIDRIDPRAKELRAVIIRRDVGRGDSTIILLNPVYENAETLGDALALLLARTRSPSGAMDTAPIALLTTGRPRTVAPRVLARLNEKLDQLRAAPETPAGRMGRVGRSVVLTDLLPYLPREP